MKYLGRLLLLLALALAVSPLIAQSYPAKPVRIVCPFPAGGLSDTFLRALAQGLTKHWGQQVLVENRPGANTMIAADFTAKSPPDGYTILMASDATLSINPFLYSKLTYDPVKDFIPVVSIHAVPAVLVVSPALGVDSLQGLLALAKAKPRELNYGSFGMGSTPHLDTEYFNERSGISLTHVPYKGGADVLPALAGNQIQVAIVGVAGAAPFIRSNRVKAIATLASRRLPALPDVPTMGELGMTGFDTRAAWNGLVVPAATPRTLVDQIARDVAQVITEREFEQRFVINAGLEPLVLGPDPFAEHLNADRRKHGAEVRKLNIRLD